MPKSTEFKRLFLRELREAVYSTGAFQSLAELLREQHGWQGEEGSARAYLSHQMSGSKHFPAVSLPLVYQVTGRDLTSVLQMEQLRISMEIRKSG